MKQETQSDEEDDEMEEGETAEDHGEKVDKDFVVNKKKKKSEDTVTVQFPKKILDNPDLISMLDRTKTTPNAGLGVVAALLQTGKVVGENGEENVDLDKFTFSYGSLKRAGAKNRKVTADAIFKQFLLKKPAAAVLHWDGKLMDNFLGTKDEKLAILASGAPDYIEGKLLSIPSLCDKDGDPTSTGLAQAEACWVEIEKYKLEDNLVGLTFDTTSSNTGCNRGAVKLLEEMLKRPLLHFGCRHHFPELMVKACWYVIFDEDLSPDNQWFVDFKKGWSDLDTSPTVAVRKLDQVIRSRQLRSLKTEAVKSYMHLLTHKNKKGLLPRDDYKELAVLALVLLGEVPPGGFKSWLAPGATHKARFMNFGIYAMKMYLFSDQLGYTMEVVNGLQRMATYISLIYARFFLNASVGADAPVNDLDLHKQLFSFQSHDADLANKSLEVLSRHGWYLDQTIVPFAFFSEKVSMEEKAQLAKKMLSFAPKSENPEFEIQRQRFPEILPNTKLEDLLGDRSFLIFSLLKIGYGWLSTPVDDWEDNLDYVKAQTFVRTAKTVNDVAERAVKLMTDYSKILTKDDATRQLIMQGVAENRKMYNNFNKKTLNKKNVTK